MTFAPPSQHPYYLHCCCNCWPSQHSLALKLQNWWRRTLKFVAQRTALLFWICALRKGTTQTFTQLLQSYYPTKMFLFVICNKTMSTILFWEHQLECHCQLRPLDITEWKLETAPSYTLSKCPTTLQIQNLTNAKHYKYDKYFTMSYTPRNKLGNNKFSHP